MFKKIKEQLHGHEHWFAEWWSGVLLVVVGFYGAFIPQNETLYKSVSDGFIVFLPNYVWQLAFASCGFLQLFSLLSESLIGRAVSAFIAAFLLLWGTLNIFVYGQQWHFSEIAWGVFAVMNLYALTRILASVEERCGCV